MQPAEALLTCRDVLEGHAGYLDGTLPVREARRFDAHLKVCPSCERYDRVVRRGLLLARNLPDIQPSANFHERLQARLMNLEAEPPRQPIMASSATALVVAAVLAVIALTPLLRLMESEPFGEPSAADLPVVPTSFIPVDAATLIPTPPANPSAPVLEVYNGPSYYLQVDNSLPPVWLTAGAPGLIPHPSVQAATNR